MAIGRDTKITWLGHATFLVDTPGNKRLIVDPWVSGNPACPERFHTLDRLDGMLLTHGHTDHAGDAVELAKTHTPTVIGMLELAGWLEAQGVENTIGINKGGTARVGDVSVTLSHASHSSSTPDGSYAGEAASLIVTVENGFRIYFAGATCVFSDMRLIGELYRPDVAVLPIGDHFTMGPFEAAHAIRLLGVSRVIPSHYGTFPVLTGTPAQLREQTQDVSGLEIIELEPGQTVE